MRREIENNLVYLLHQIKEVLDEHNIEFWLDCGTLLGAVRDKKIIPWEHDLDFGVLHVKFPYNLQILVAKKFSERGFKVIIHENHMNIKSNKEIWADINFYHFVNGKAVVPHKKPKNMIGKLLIMFYSVLLVPDDHKINFIKNIGIFVKSIFILISRILPSLLKKQIAKITFTVYMKIGSENVWWIVPKYHLTNLSTIKFYGREFKVPAKTEDYLEYRYGKDWRTSKKDWITERDDGAVSNFYHK